MKKLLGIASIALAITACNTTPDTAVHQNSQSPIINEHANTHTTSSAWPSTMHLQGLSDTIVTRDGVRYVKVAEQNGVQPLTTKEVHNANQKAAKPQTVRRRSPSRSQETSSAKVVRANAKKQGWSKAAKGTAIGAGTGAVAGAIISKKKGKGAVIGGLIGAGGGYVIGRAIDKKDGRY